MSFRNAHILPQVSILLSGSHILFKMDFAGLVLELLEKCWNLKCHFKSAVNVNLKFLENFWFSP